MVNVEAYLGDGVYITQEPGNYHLILSTNSHKKGEWINVIYLDSGVEQRLYEILKERNEPPCKES